MAIRKRSVADEHVLEEIDPEVLMEDEPTTDEHSDNVISRADDHRGVFDRRQDPYPGSALESLGGEDRQGAASVTRRVLFANGGDVPYPKDMQVQDLLAQARTPWNAADSVEQSYRDRIRSPMTAIRAWCIESQGGSPKAVRECTNMSCVLWPFRMGKNSFRGRV